VSQTLPTNAPALSADDIEQVGAYARTLGFSQIACAPIDLSSAEPGLRAWLDAGFAGSMHYMAAHGMKRARPAELLPGTVGVISARMDYLPDAPPVRAAADEAVVSVYAKGRDYHKVLRQRLASLGARMQAQFAPRWPMHEFSFRAFTDSAPVLEAELATRAGLGWRGKHTLVLSREAGSFFFLGELFVNVALPESAPVSDHCGSCSACIDACPTGAIVAPYRLDARRCISYLTIESAQPIPHEFRRLIGARLYGCDDCQLACPWNKFAQSAVLADFAVRPLWARPVVAELLRWTETDFLQATEGSAMRRIGYARFVRNACVVAGNALASGGLVAAQIQALVAALEAVAARTWAESEDPAEHARWALAQLRLAPSLMNSSVVTPIDT
jgi:epoxyqueuosine reductase